MNDARLQEVITLPDGSRCLVWMRRGRQGDRWYAEHGKTKRAFASRREALHWLARICGDWIRRRRTSLGMTQEDLAEALHVRAITVSRWECGRQLPLYGNAVNAIKEVLGKEAK